MAVINTNIKALFSQAALKSTDRSQTVAMQQLSTGTRINSARDDAAGMAIATRMTQQTNAAKGTWLRSKSVDLSRAPRPGAFPSC